MSKRKHLLFFSLILYGLRVIAQSQPAKPVRSVNVFLGTSGDHGQLSPAASYPFSMLSIGPQTYPKLHAGYEYEAKRFLGFTHNRFEGVGCQGSGGNILIKPFLGDAVDEDLIKVKQSGEPGYYRVDFTNKITAELTVFKKSGAHRYTFPNGKKGFFINLAHTLNNKFVAEKHEYSVNSLKGWVEARTTCGVGTYKIYYYITFDQAVQFQDVKAHQLTARLISDVPLAGIRVGMSSVDTNYAKASIYPGTFDQMRIASSNDWNNVLSRISVTGPTDRMKLFYSLLYRTLQSPYAVSESDGTYRGTNGVKERSGDIFYNGWSIWDNYRTQLPLLSVGWPEKYKDMVSSLARLYTSGKKDYARQTEPTNTVRTEHAIVVLLDAHRKGYPVNFAAIADSLIREVDQLDFSKPDKALESSYDTWALSEIMDILKNTELSKKYRAKALDYQKYWKKDFMDMTQKDVDRVQARDLYQGTIWQYRWFVPYDVKGLIQLTGGEKEYLKQLNYFFDNDLYNHANEPDLQAPLMYNMTAQPWRSQELMHRFAADTVVQYYFNDNSRGIDPFIDKVYKNEPKAYIRTMDDDAGAMSSWYVLTACGFSPACLGWPVYYLNVPLMSKISFEWPSKKPFEIAVQNFSLSNKYIKKITLNGKVLDRNYITQDEILFGGKMVIEASAEPQQPPVNLWISHIEKL